MNPDADNYNPQANVSAYCQFLGCTSLVLIGDPLLMKMTDHVLQLFNRVQILRHIIIIPMQMKIMVLVYLIRIMLTLFLITINIF